MYFILSYIISSGPLAVADRHIRHTGSCERPALAMTKSVNGPVPVLEGLNRQAFPFRRKLGWLLSLILSQLYSIAIYRA